MDSVFQGDKARILTHTDSVLWLELQVCVVLVSGLVFGFFLEKAGVQEVSVIRAQMKMKSFVMMKVRIRGECGSMRCAMRAAASSTGNLVGCGTPESSLYHFHLISYNSICKFIPYALSRACFASLSTLHHPTFSRCSSWARSSVQPS